MCGVESDILFSTCIKACAADVRLFCCSTSKDGATVHCVAPVCWARVKESFVMVQQMVVCSLAECQGELWMTFKKSFVSVVHKHSNLFRKHAGVSNQLNASNAQLQDRARAMSHIRQLERQEIEQKPHPPLSAPTLNFGAPCHDFSSHGRERSESFLLLSMPREDMLTHAKSSAPSSSRKINCSHRCRNCSLV